MGGRCYKVNSGGAGREGPLGDTACCFGAWPAAWGVVRRFGLGPHIIVERSGMFFDNRNKVFTGCLF